MDIRKAEQIATTVSQAVDIDPRQFNRILHENNWSKHKHLFARTLSTDDFLAFERFFDCCVQIDKSRSSLEEALFENIKAKSAVILSKIGDIQELTSPKGQEQKKRIVEEFGNDTYSFNPAEPSIRIRQNLALMGRLSTSVAFEKLRRISKIR